MRRQGKGAHFCRQGKLSLALSRISAAVALQNIREYAQSIGVAPCILVGRLLHDQLIDYLRYSDLRPPFEIEY